MSGRRNTGTGHSADPSVKDLSRSLGLKVQNLEVSLEELRDPWGVLRSAKAILGLDHRHYLQLHAAHATITDRQKRKDSLQSRGNKLYGSLAALALQRDFMQRLVEEFNQRLLEAEKVVQLLRDLKLHHTKALRANVRKIAALHRTVGGFNLSLRKLDHEMSSIRQLLSSDLNEPT